MSRVLLINLSSLPMPGNEPIFPIGVRCIEQALQRVGHDVRLLDFVENPAAIDDWSWAEQRWDVIGFAMRNIDPIDLSCDGHVDAYADFVRRVKETVGPGVVLVGGGPGFSLFAESLTQLLALHVGVRGPGEEVMIEIASNPQRYTGGRSVMDGRRYEGFVNDILTHPDSLMRAYAVDRRAMIGVETRRKTCFQRCIYCPYAYITGQNSGDQKPIEILRAEISGIYAAGFRRIFFTDSIFNSGITYAKQIVRLLAEQLWPGLSWGAYFAARPFDNEFAALLARSGAESIVVSPDSLDNELMGRLGKNFDLKAMDQFVETCRRHELRLMVNVVFGGPGETRQTVANTVRYINTALDAGELSMHFGFRILPHTALSAETTLGEDELLYPAFYPFDLDLFQWVIHDLEPRFVTTQRLMNLLAGRASMRRMEKIGASDTQINPTGTPRFVAMSRVRPPKPITPITLHK